MEGKVNTQIGGRGEEEGVSQRGVRIVDITQGKLYSAALSLL